MSWNGARSESMRSPETCLQAIERLCTEFGIESLQHANAIVLGAVLAELELSLDPIDWHLKRHDGS